MKRVLAVLGAVALAAALSFPVSAAKPQPFAWTFSSGGIGGGHPNGCLGEDSYGNWYGRGSVDGTIEFRLHFCDETDLYPGTDVCVCSPGGAALIVRTSGKWPLPITVYAPEQDPSYGPPRPTVYTATSDTPVCITFDPPFPDQGGGSGYPIPGGDYRIVVSGVTKDMYGYIQVGMSYASWVTTMCQPLDV